MQPEEDMEAAVEKSPGRVSLEPLPTGPRSEPNTTPGDITATTATDAAEYRRLIRKLDLRLLPPLFVLWFISLIDRVNIGAARLQGLERDLGIDPRSSGFNLAAVVVFAGLVLAEVPSNYLLRRLPPPAVLCGECLALGAVTAAQGLVRNLPALVALRTLVGVLEAGLIPGSVFLLAAYYPRYELQWRLSALHVGNAASNALGGLLAYAVAGIHSSNGYSGWRWIFIVEGLATMVVTCACWPFMSGWPKQARWLADGEREILEERIRADGGIGRMDVLDRRAVVRCVTDWKVYAGGLLIVGDISSVYSITLFAPTIVAALRPATATAREIQALVIPIFVAAAAWTLAIAYASDRLRHRAGFALLGCVVALAGYAVLLTEDSPGARYGALYLVAAGSFGVLPSAWVLLLNNVAGAYKTAFAVGMQIGLGNAGGFVASLAFQARTAPRYRMGFRLCGGLMGVAFLTVCVYVAGLWWENRRKRAGKRDHLLEEEGDNLGDAHPRFIYTY
ncbi:Major facilitator superfamily domain, general substrate transporter [Cordyceps fumosorosea ARSEF 2679]|uniref:Major facilitator superfamily domain, general substrate transporter n=1 Tax=Cordyceps fumosorosea (strain ARSEF 2679) TaxID=1081104 RepID=A0A168E071_CORFA|nr:Major facilitator superfamily domain, general substrate transporter [Cordyceps fumosorosea ARSEF 2679]OAA73217.1 Major facilitator superfamily domain, general substrate transporter [Cordyceps fumosorosea ARSEF 2679]